MVLLCVGFAQAAAQDPPKAVAPPAKAPAARVKVDAVAIRFVDEKRTEREYFFNGARIGQGATALDELLNKLRASDPTHVVVLNDPSIKLTADDPGLEKPLNEFLDKRLGILGRASRDAKAFRTVYIRIQDGKPLIDVDGRAVDKLEDALPDAKTLNEKTAFTIVYAPSAHRAMRGTNMKLEKHFAEKPFADLIVFTPLREPATPPAKP
ncbi:MAG: hypothetical protein QM811_22285 [Pirellulales bacterium]